MNCILKTHEQEELLLGYCCAALEPETARTYERHIQSCSYCRSMLELQQLVDESMNDWKAPEVSENFDRKLFARIRREEARPQAWWQILFPASWGWKPAIPLALAALALVVFMLRSPDPSTLGQQGDGLKSDEIELVERALDDIEALHALHHTDAESAQKEVL